MTEKKIPYHPRQCHLCRFNGANGPGRPFDETAAAACLACKDPGLPHDGISWVHLDAAENPATVYLKRTAPEWNPGKGSGRVLSGKSDAAADWAKMLYCELSVLDDTSIRVLYRLAHAVPFMQAAADLCMPPRQFAGRVRTLLKTCGHLREIVRLVRSGEIRLPVA